MKKIQVIFVALIAISAIILAGCEDTELLPNVYTSDLEKSGQAFVDNSGQIGQVISNPSLAAPYNDEWHCNIENGQIIPGLKQEGCPTEIPVPGDPYDTSLCTNPPGVRAECRCAYRNPSSCGCCAVCKCDCQEPKLQNDIFSQGKGYLELCSSDLDCRNSEILNTKYGSRPEIKPFCSKGVCKLGDCDTDSDCTAGSTCDPAYRECTAPACTKCSSDSECSAGFCTMSGCCGNSECSSGIDCPAGNDCASGRCLGKFVCCGNEAGECNSICSRIALDETLCATLTNTEINATKPIGCTEGAPVVTPFVCEINQCLAMCDARALTLGLTVPGLTVDSEGCVVGQCCCTFRDANNVQLPEYNICQKSYEQPFEQNI